ncbi:HAD family hydrolase [Maribacter hydrothermalis]|uniref:Haloacid dehalogenase n=1 Tax=Maribacter hydrothermalis TaxID=1836467 RepID=A0A1B7Z2F0_9FLAO|nr:HAD family hydrolase [Maribacter hydrothermalis]APQ18385.1 haloacid dehalogenase [Maribacter hydrothermalis]OBR36730.1 haloacid dehalogenase [Maribacter hydrothermalis]
MDLSKIKMVVSDMDGTLLNSNHQVSDQFFDIFKDLKSQGITFVAASGRQYNSIIDKLDAIKDDIIVIAENGGFAMKQQTEILATPLEKQHVQDILKTLDDIPNIHPVLCTKHKAYLTDKSNAFVTKLAEYYTEYEILESLSKFNSEVIKIAIYHFESSEAHIYPFVKHFEAHLKVKVSGENWLDISNMNANKGYALDKLMKTYNLKSDEVMVFGDFNNDLEMLALSDFGFAMENAHPNVKRVAKYSTLSNDENGVEHILKMLIT